MRSAFVLGAVCLLLVVGGAAFFGSSVVLSATPPAGSAPTPYPVIGIDHTTVEYEATVVVEASPAAVTYFNSVVHIEIPARHGTQAHPHVGTGTLMVMEGQICLARTDDNPATMQLIRGFAAPPETSAGAGMGSAGCGEIAPYCEIDDDDSPCAFQPCPDGCELQQGQSVWLGQGDTVVQSGPTRHLYLNVGAGDERAVLYQLVHSSNESGELGCRGDCL